MPRNAYQIRKRSHDWHRDGGLAGTGRNNDVKDILYHKHAEGGKGGRHLIQYACKRMDDGIHDVGVGHDDGRGFAETHHKAGEQHIGAAFYKAVGNLGRFQSADDACDDSHNQEERGQLVNIKAEFRDADH